MPLSSCTSGPEDCPTDADPRDRVKLLVPFTNPVILGKFVYQRPLECGSLLPLCARTSRCVFRIARESVVL